MLREPLGSRGEQGPHPLGTRLPPPVMPNMNPTGVPHPDWYDACGSWDGSVSIPNGWNGLTSPVILMDIVEGTPPRSGSGSRSDSDVAHSREVHYVPRHLRSESNEVERAAAGDPPTMAVVHATNASDPFLLSWTKDTPNPIVFTGKGTAFPSEVWKNGDHWNFLAGGVRYTTKDPMFHTWAAAAGGRFINESDRGGMFFGLIANKPDGTHDPAWCRRAHSHDQRRRRQRVHAGEVPRCRRVVDYHVQATPSGPRAKRELDDRTVCKRPLP
jgi:hypothetical protein